MTAPVTASIEDSAAARYAAVYDAALAAEQFPDHSRPGDQWAEWAELFRRDPQRPLDANLSVIAGYLHPADRLVDVGGGAGRVSLALAGQVAAVTLVEPSAAMREQFSIARAAAGINNARVTPDWWQDSPETGDVVHLSDVTYFVRDIAPFVAKLHRAAARRVLLTVWHPPPGNLDAELRRILYGVAPPRWPGLPELAAVLWEMELLPQIIPLPALPWWIPETAGGLSDAEAIDLALRRLDQSDDATRRLVSDNLDALFARTGRGLTPRWLAPAREVLLTWETGGVPRTPGRRRSERAARRQYHRAGLLLSRQPRRPQRDGDGYRDPGLFPDYGGSMPLAGQIVGQQDIAGAEPPLGAVADADFHFAGQGDDILAARGVVPVGEIARLKAPEVDAGGYLHPAVHGALSGQFQILKMRLAVIPGINTHEHSCGASCWVGSASVSVLRRGADGLRRRAAVILAHYAASGAPPAVGIIAPLRYNRPQNARRCSSVGRAAVS